MNTLSQETVKIEQIGTFAKVIALDYKIKDNEHLASLISEHFNVICTLEDIEEYELRHQYYEELNHEDFELESRRTQFPDYSFK